MGMGKVLRELGVKVNLLFDKHSASEADKSIKSMAKELAYLGLQAGISAGSILGLAKVAGKHSRELDNNAEALGINVERLQELQYAAQTAAGVTKEELTGSLEGLSKTLYEARNHNIEAGRSLVNLGISLEDLKDPSITADVMFGKISNRFAGMQNGAYKTALANEVLGASGARLIPLMNKGAKGIADLGKEGRAFGAVLSTSVIKENEEFDIQLSKIWVTLKAISYTIGHEIIKWLTPLVMQFQSFIKANRQMIGLGIAGVFKSIGIMLTILYKAATWASARLMTLVNIFGGIQRVAKALGYALGFILAGKLLAALSFLATPLKIVFTLMTGISAPVLLVAAAFAAVLLVAEDIYTFFNGGDSLTGDFLKSEMLTAFIDKLKSIKDFVMGLVDSVKMLVSTFAQFASGLAGTALGKIADTVSAVGGYMGFSSAAPAGAGSGGTQNNTTAQNQFKTDITVQIPPGTSVKDATNIVSGGVESGMDGMLRGARNKAAGGVAY